MCSSRVGGLTLGGRSSAVRSVRWWCAVPVVHGWHGGAGRLRRRRLLRLVPLVLLAGGARVLTGLLVVRVSVPVRLRAGVRLVLGGVVGRSVRRGSGRDHPCAVRRDLPRGAGQRRERADYCRAGIRLPARRSPGAAQPGGGAPLRCRRPVSAATSVARRATAGPSGGARPVPSRRRARSLRRPRRRRTSARRRRRRGGRRCRVRRSACARTAARVWGAHRCTRRRRCHRTAGRARRRRHRRAPADGRPGRSPTRWRR